MKKRMLALLLTLCMVVSLLPAQLVSADMASNVTIKGNGSKFVLYKDGAAVSGLTQNYELNVPAGSTLRNEGYEVRDWDRDLQYFVSWSANGVDLGNDAAMLDYVIPANTSVVFEAGWIGVGGNGNATPDWSITADKNPVNVGEIVTLTTNEPAGDPFDFCEWHVSDPDLALVSGYGNHATMQALAAGTVTVSLETAIGTRSIDITINPAQGGSSVIALGDNNLIGSAAVVPATFTPYWESGEYVFFVEGDNFNWDISFDKGVAVTAHRTYGAFGYRADLVEGVTYNVEIHNQSGENLRLRMMKISPDAPDLAFPEDTLEHAYIGDEWGFPVLSVAPDGKIGSNIQWSVDDPSVVKMTPNGERVTLNFLAAGVVTLTAVDVDNNKSVSHTITVYDPNDPNGGPGGNDTPNATVIAFNLGQEATYIITDDGYVGEPTDGAGFHIPDGSSLKAEGYTISEPVFWEPSREFLGWRACTLEPFYEEGQFMYYDYVQIPGTGFMNTAQMLEYTIPADTNVYFMGEWAGDDSDYYSSVAFDGFGGEFDIYFGNEYYSTTDWDNFGYNREGGVIGTEMSRYFEGALDVVNMRSERGDFRGWIQYTWSDESGWTMVEREDNLVTWEALELLVPEEDTVFVARWEGVSWDEYLNYGKDHGGEGGGEGDFVFPEDATYTELFLDQKAPLLGEQENYYTFTAPADGYYSLCYDSFETGLDIWDNQNVYYWVIPETGKIVVYLEAGQEYVFRAVAALDCQIWIEKALAITKLEILEFDASKTVMRTNEWMGAYLLDGMTVKATFEDGTTKTVTMPNEVGEYTLDGYEPMLQYDFENATGTTGVVTLYYGDASDTFTVKLLDKKVTNVEVVPGTLEVTEYTQGWLNENEDGFVFEYHFPRILEAKGTLRFTWSDNTTETLAYDANNPYFYGLYLGWDYAAENWTAGNTYDVSIYYGGIESSVAVKILESSVEKLEIINDITAALCEPEFAQNPDGSWFLNDVDLNEMEFKVTFKDQISKTYKFSDLREDRYDYYAGDYPIYLAPQDYALLDNITGPCEIPLVLFVGGKSAELSIHVVEKLVEDNQTTVGSPAIDEALKNETDGEIVVDGTSSEQGDANVPAVNLPATSLDKVADAGVDMTVKMDNAQVTFDQKAVESIAQQAGEAEAAQVQLSVEAVPMDQLTDKQRHKIESVMKNSDETPLVLDITLSVGEETISNFHGGNATIRVPFTPAEGSDGGDYAVWYIPEDGKQVQQMKTTYEDGYLIFTTNHFSEYVAMKEDLSAGDTIPGDINGDGNVTDRDVIALLWHVLFPSTNPIESDGDINGDGVITDRDVIALLWHVLFPTTNPL